MSQLRDVLYILSFSLFVIGLMGLTGPRTAVRGNRIAAVGMGVAVIATLLRPEVHNWGLIVLGAAVGTAARRVKMTAMPQMVALFNGVGGGAVALIAWAECRSSAGFSEDATYVAIFTGFAAIVGSISFWAPTSPSRSCRRSSPAARSAPAVCRRRSTRCSRPWPSAAGPP